jgi:hypothetical protein
VEDLGFCAEDEKANDAGQAWSARKTGVLSQPEADGCASNCAPLVRALLDIAGSI